jgi:aspartate/methionine/tyrosine aminotransferase
MFSKRTSWERQENELSRATLELRASGRRIFDLTRSNPTECGFAYDEEAIRRALGRSGVGKYRPTALGQVSAREVVAEYYRADHGAEIRCEDLVLTSGTSEGYSFLFRLLCNAGDEVLIPAPG